MKLYVGNLSYSIDEPELRSTFEHYGEVVDLVIITDRYTGQSKGFGFVEMANRAQAESAISALNGKELSGRQIKVNEARPRNDRRGGGMGYGGPRGGGRGRQRY